MEAKVEWCLPGGGVGVDLDLLFQGTEFQYEMMQMFCRCMMVMIAHNANVLNAAKLNTQKWLTW